MDEEERERWRGTVDQQIKALEIKTDTMFRLHEALALELKSIEILHTTLVGTVSNISLKVGMLATIGALVGGGAMQYIISVLQH